MDAIKNLHYEAMNVADEADVMKRMAQSENAIALYAKAYELERQAAMEARSCGMDDTAVSILAKSAACLAYDAKLYRESEQMVGLALSCNLPDEIAEEMRDLLENIHFSRHLRLNGVTLSDNELQIVVAGRGVAHGMVRENDVNDRISVFKKIAIRTVERAKGCKFRAKGSPPKDIMAMCESYLSAPRAASFAVTMRLGGQEENLFDDVQSAPNALIEDIATNLQYANNGDLDSLQSRIKEPSYLENFVGLAKEFAPDGDSVNLVGITYIKDGKEVPVQLQRTKKEYKSIVTSLSERVKHLDDKSDEDKILTLTGVLSAADSSLDTVKLSIENKKESIVVPEGLSDIVKRYFDEMVIIEVRSQADKKILLNIDMYSDGQPELFN